MPAHASLGVRTQAWIHALATPLFRLLVRPLAALYFSARYYLCVPPTAWSRRFYVAVNLWRTTSAFFSLGRLPPRDPLEAAVIRAGFAAGCAVERVWCGPLRPDVPRVSVLSRARDIVQPVAVPCFMIERDSEDMDGEQRDLLRPAAAGERAILYFVGGGYTHGHPLAIHTAWSLAKQSGARVLCPNYRKSLSDDTAFPAALYDLLAGWQYLVDELAFRPKDIMLAGESAGANACLALGRYLDELRERASYDWGLPGAMWIPAPWCDMTGLSPSLERNKHTDTVAGLDSYRTPSHTRHFPGDLANPYFSPALASDRHYARLAAAGTQVYVSAGTAEILYDQIVALRDNLRRARVDVTYREFEGAIHTDYVRAMQPGIDGAGWTWPATRADFELFWAETA